ncbi:MAG: hypothetical protein Kow00106_11660 [Anaerolineae bacterium]
MVDPITWRYLETLPELDTMRLPLGTLFWANGRLYQVVETGSGGYHKAREWRKTEETEVALVPGSSLSRRLPLVRRGRVLPVYKSRRELMHDDQPTCFIFPNETLALDAAYLDVALIASAGAYVRAQGREPAFVATDGAHVYRYYFFRHSAGGRATDLSALQARPLPFKPQPHTAGPLYWRLLPNWTEADPPTDRTREMRPFATLNNDDTLPHITLPDAER